MKTTRWIKAAGLVATASLLYVHGAVAAPDSVRDFGLIDHQGDQHQLTRLGYHDAVVVIAQSNNCSVNVEKLHKYKLLRTTWESHGVKFLMMNSSLDDDLNSIRQKASVYDIDFPIMNDEGQLAAETLDVKRAGEIFVIDPDNMELVFRGPLDEPARDEDDPHTPLADALAAVTEGEHRDMDTIVEPMRGEADDCGLSFPTQEMHAENVPDYHDDVAPILKENCANCHVEGGIGPFAMDSYDMVRGWAPMIREVVMTKRMPPAQVDPEINHFTNANYLSVEDEQTLVHWIDAGAPRGDSEEDPLHAVEPKEQTWQLGEPDMVVDVPAYEVPATGVIDYFNHTIDLPFEEDKYVRAVQFIPGDDRVLHHLLAYITSPDKEDDGVVREENIRDFLEGYAPGKTEATTFPEDTGVFIPEGYNLTMQMHYTTFGKAVVDETKVGLYFYDEKPDYKYITKPISHGGSNLVIEPHDPEHEMNHQYVFENDTMLYALRPHMHYRGKAFRFSAIFPDGRRETLLNVPGYNFAWQPTYRLEEPIKLPAGTRVVTDGVFDNSKFNPGNPDPEDTVRGGPQSWDEMFIGYFTYTDLEEPTAQKGVSFD